MTVFDDTITEAERRIAATFACPTWSMGSLCSLLTPYEELLVAMTWAGILTDELPEHVIHALHVRCEPLGWCRAHEEAK